MDNTLDSDKSGYVTKHSETKDKMEVVIENDANPETGPIILPEEYARIIQGSSEFNIQGNYIDQAALGNTGDVTFNQTTKTYDKGARHDNYAISGGNFPQATIGGASTYNNKDSAITSGGGAMLKPEELMIYILEKGVACKQLKDLLERKYTLAQIAFSIPTNARLREHMIKAMLLR